MPTYNVTSPEGKKYRITAPEGATPEQIKEFIGKQQKPSETERQQVEAGFGEEGIGPVGADQDFDVQDLVDLGIIKQENVQGRSLGEIAKDPEIQRNVLELGAMTLGSAAFPAVGATVYPRIAEAMRRIAGASIGGGAGSLIAETVDPSEEPFKEAAETAGAAAIGEAGAMGVAKLGSKVLAPYKDRLVEGARTAFEKIAERKGVITPGKLTTSRLIDTIEGVSEASILGGGKIAKTQEQAIETARGLADEFYNSFSRSATKEEADILLQDAVKGGSQYLKEIGGAYYRRVDELVKDATVDISKMKKMSETMLSEAQKGLRSPDVEKLAKEIAAKGNRVTFEEANALRSDLLNVSRQKEEGLVAGKGEAFAKRLAGVADESIQTASQGLDKEAYQAWRQANDFWSKKSKLFNNQVVKNIATKEPDRLYESAIKYNNPATISKVKQVIGDEEVWKQVQGRFVQDIFDKSKNELGELSGQKLMKQIKKWQDGGSLKQVLKPDEAIALKEIARTLQIAESPASKEKIGSVAIQLLQVGAAGTVFQLNENKKEGAAQASAIIFGPAVMAKMLTSPSFARWLSIGYKAPPGSKQAAEAITRLTALINENKE